MVIEAMLMRVREDRKEAEERERRKRWRQGHRNMVSKVPG